MVQFLRLLNNSAPGWCSDCLKGLGRDGSVPVGLDKTAGKFAHLRALLDHSIDPVLVIDLESWCILDANSPACAKLQCAYDTLCRLRLEDFLGEADFERVAALVPESGDERMNIDATLLTRANDTVPVELSLSVDGQDDLEVGILFIREAIPRSAPSLGDVEAHAQEAAEGNTMDGTLRDQDLRFQTLAHSVPAGIFLTDSKGQLVYMNERWNSITGLSFSESYQRSWLAGIHDEDRERVTAAWQDFIDSGSDFDLEFRFHSSEGDGVWVSGRAVTFCTDTGRPIGFLGMLMDITSLKNAEQQLKSSEAKYRTIFENIVDVYYETALDGEILELSPSIENFSGYAREDLIGQTMLNFYVDETRRQELVKELAESGAVHDFEIDLLNKDGKPMPCSITAKLERDNDGNPAKIVGTMRDISLRKSMESMLTAEREILELIAMDRPLMDILDHLVLSVESVTRGMLCSILLLDDDGERLRLGAAPSLPTNYNCLVEGIRIGPDAGSCGTAAYTKNIVIVADIAKDPRWNELRDEALRYRLRACWSNPILSSTGQVLGTFAMYYTEPREPDPLHLQMIRGATHLAAIALERAAVQAENRNLEAQMRQAQKLESLGVLAGGIAHDFNNLLTGIMGYASLAAHTLEKEQSPALKQVHEIRKVAERAADLTRQMLAYSGKGTFNILPVDLGKVAEDLAHLLSISITKKACLTCNFDKNLPLIEADATQLQQIVMNLITNASDALGEENGDITVSTGVVNASEEYLAESCLDSAIPAGEYAYIEVSDTGCGMDAETISKIFDPFFTTKVTGRGLGMSAVLGIMRGHKGTIKIDSVPDVGTTIRLLFPCLSTDAVIEEPAPSEDDTATESWQGEGIVLVADDEEFLREMASAMLRSSGYRVETAVDGADCLEVYKRHRKDIVALFMDLTMPKMDGYEVLDELRAMGSDVPVVLSSGYNFQEIKKRLNGADYQGFVQKPYMRQGLVEAIREVALKSKP